MRSIRPYRSGNRGAQHQPALIGGKVAPRMARAAIVPEQKIAEAPDMLVNEFRLLGVIEQRASSSSLSALSISTMCMVISRLT